MRHIVKADLLHFLDSPCGRTARRRTGDGSETGKTSDLSAPSAASRPSQTTKREKLEQPPSPHWRERLDEREKHRDQRTDTAKDLPLGDKSWDRTVTSELGCRPSASLDRKRKLERDSFMKVKKMATPTSWLSGNTLPWALRERDGLSDKGEQLHP
ncbi:uncharacterized protein AKAME5_000613300 [Lates japonicus]|uniref:Uncharacterized protein n=1 Tax=Lates japonicus TaxID=270547 RepID=A0AAD3R343_LATJO|nr:uncharacterized protein AKAME5_000613300 [Lates japonicus]